MLIVAGFILILILGLETLFTVLLATPDGVRMKSPDGTSMLDRTFMASGDAWMREGTSSVRVSAVSRDSTRAPLSFAASRDIVSVFAAIFGPSPRYVIGLEIVAIAVFALLYVPWPIARWIRAHAQRRPGHSAT
jgi:hypothetical protein